MKQTLHSSPIYSILFYMYHQTKELTSLQLEDTVTQGWITEEEKQAILAGVEAA